MVRMSIYDFHFYYLMNGNILICSLVFNCQINASKTLRAINSVIINSVTVRTGLAIILCPSFCISHRLGILFSSRVGSYVWLIHKKIMMCL